jgi:hypothetical protein
MQGIARQLERWGLPVDVFDWVSATECDEHNRYYSMTCLRAAARNRLDAYANKGKRVIILTHSAGGFVLGHWINHPAVVGALYLAIPPLGPYAKRGAGWLHPTTLKIGWRSLLGAPVEFTKYDMRVYGTPERFISGSVWESGLLMRGFRFPGYQIPHNDQHKPAWFHASPVDTVITPLERVMQGMHSLGYRLLEGGQELKHCDYLSPSVSHQRSFMSSKVLPAIEKIIEQD